MNSKKSMKPMIGILDVPSKRKRQYSAIDNLETEYINIKDEKPDYKNFESESGEEMPENEDYFGEESDPLTATASSNLGHSLGNWARKNQMSYESFSDLTKVLKRGGLNIPNCYTPIKQSSQLQKMNALLTTMNNQVNELKLQNTGIINKMKLLETQLSKCKSILDNIFFDLTHNKPPEFVSTSTFKYNLPINTFEDLDDLEEHLNENNFFEDFVNIVQKLGLRNPENRELGCSRITYTKSCPLCLVLGKTIIMEYNWDGSQSKKPLQNLKNLNRALFEAWRGGEITKYDEYVAFVRMKLHLAKKRLHQERYRSSKKIN